MCSHSSRAGEQKAQSIDPPPDKVLQLPANSLRGSPAAELGRQASIEFKYS